MVIYTVQPGDTLYQISQRFGVSPQRAIVDNSIPDPRNLPPGQNLLLLTPAGTYPVRQGDTLSSIAARYGVTVQVLLQNNPQLILSPTLHVGQEVVIHFTAGKRRQVAVNGYAYDYIIPDVLRRALPYLTYLTIFGYGFTPDGRLIPPEDRPLIALAREHDVTPVMHLSPITEDGNFNPQRASALFNDPALQERVLLNILAAMDQKGYEGLDIDFEFIEPQDSAAYLRFLENAAGKLHSAGHFLHVDLAPKTSDAQQGLLYESHNYGAIGEIADSVLLMTYEWGYTYGPPMAVAPLNQGRRGVTRATAIGNEYAVDIARRQGAFIQFDQTAQSPYFDYYRDGLSHVVWFEDVRSIEQKYNLMDEFGLAGGGYWNLMRPFQQNWSFVAARYNIINAL